MEKARDRLKSLNPELHQTLEQCWDIAISEWLPAVSMKDDSYNSLPHLLNLERYLETILVAYEQHPSSGNKQLLTPAELYVMLSSILLHDIGKFDGLSSGKNKDKDHGEVSQETIINRHAYLGIHSKTMAGIIGDVCSVHNLPPDGAKNKICKLTTHFVEHYGEIRVRELAALLILIDHMDSTSSRIPPEYIRQSSDTGSVGAFRRAIEGVKLNLDAHMICIKIDDSIFDEEDGNTTLKCKINYDKYPELKKTISVNTIATYYPYTEDTWTSNYLDEVYKEINENTEASKRLFERIISIIGVDDAQPLKATIENIKKDLIKNSNGFVNEVNKIIKIIFPNNLEMLNESIEIIGNQFKQNDTAVNKKIDIIKKYIFQSDRKIVIKTIKDYLEKNNPNIKLNGIIEEIEKNININDAESLTKTIQNNIINIVIKNTNLNNTELLEQILQIIQTDLINDDTKLLRAILERIINNCSVAQRILLKTELETKTSKISKKCTATNLTKIFKESSFILLHWSIVRQLLFVEKNNNIQWPPTILMAMIMGNTLENVEALEPILPTLSAMGLGVKSWLIDYRGHLYNASGEETYEPIFSRDYLKRVAEGMWKLSTQVMFHDTFTYKTLAAEIREPNAYKVWLAVNRLNILSNDYTFVKKMLPAYVNGKEKLIDYIVNNGGAFWVSQHEWKWNKRKVCLNQNNILPVIEVIEKGQCAYVPLETINTFIDNLKQPC